MVDYTKKEMRDESWRRWKGGKKLAEDLRIFYTSKRALDRIAANNAGHGMADAKPERNGRGQRLRLVQRLHQNSPGQRNMRNLRRAANRRPAEAAAPYPGQSSPTR